MLPNLSGIMLHVWTISQHLSWCQGARYVNDEGILVDNGGILLNFQQLRRNTNLIGILD